MWSNIKIFNWFKKKLKNFNQWRARKFFASQRPEENQIPESTSNVNNVEPQEIEELLQENSQTNTTIENVADKT